MDSVLIETPVAANSPNLGLAFNRSYDSMLKESIDRFLSSIHSGILDFSTFRSIFSRLLHSSVDPPLEVVWFYSATYYHESLSSSKRTIDRVLAVKNLLQLFAACSAACSGLKSIALLAPAVSELYYCVLELGKVSGSDAKKLKREIEGLVEGVLSYISICSGKGCDVEDFGCGLLPCFLDLVQVWTVGQSENGSRLEVFFPLVDGEIREKFKEEGCGIGFLAGVVIVEALLLRLCLKVRGSVGLREELQKELRVWAVSSLTVFQNRVFFEILLRLLLEQKLPITSLLDAKDENLIRDILYDVVILVDYSFLNPAMDVDRTYDLMRCLVVQRLLVTHKAIQSASKRGDHGKAISYMSAFSTSSAPNQIVKWVSDQLGQERTKKPDANTPQVLLKWLAGLEEQGLRVFNDGMLKHQAKLMSDESKPTSDISMSKLESKNADADLFFIDKEGDVAEDEEMEPMDAAFLAAARSMRSSVLNRRRKRRDLGGEEESRTKFSKYKVHASPTKDHLQNSVAGGTSSGSEVDNPHSDDEMEDNLVNEV